MKKTLNVGLIGSGRLGSKYADGGPGLRCFDDDWASSLGTCSSWCSYWWKKIIKGLQHPRKVDEGGRCFGYPRRKLHPNRSHFFECL